MGQDWVIVNLDKRVFQKLSKLGESIWEVQLNDYFTRRYRIWSSQQIMERIYEERNIEKPIPSPTPQSKSVLFQKLALELIEMVFAANNDDFDTNACLALTCRRAWDIGAVKFFTPHLEPCRGSWNGDRVIIFGHYARFNDLPDGIFTAEEQTFIDDALAAAQRTEDPGYATMSVCKRFVYGRCVRLEDPLSYRRPIHHLLRKDVLADQWAFTVREARSRIDWNGTGFIDADEGEWEYREPPDILNEGIKTYEVATHLADTVLRNLTTKEYVRGEAFAQSLADAEAEDWDIRWDFGDLLAMRICWSYDPSASLAYDRGITRGRWAGHRFDIVLKDALPHDADGNVLPEWTDVSDAILDDAWHLYEVDHF
ncbi:hypothetical protein EXIGLDRAFT_846375 [Exidia glandulosa HHB12029]|uniref:Uncharacterized protein n=1 Tax=Exidia glandulosa HHB12029 TaxID=1314781 RepID=A0A165B0Q0_EXIGL|nr:hypothetical protein EXIGLDRAFT_846375 [Exidia glandulosa HHB12029]